MFRLEGALAKILGSITRSLMWTQWLPIYVTILLNALCSQVAQAGKRLSPSDPDKFRPKPATLPWFDMLRFVWRGQVYLQAQ